MPDFYACTECAYTTSSHRSYKSHSSQCVALHQAIQAREQELQNKRKRKIGQSVNLLVALNRIREAKKPRLADFEGNEAITGTSLLDPTAPFTTHNHSTLPVDTQASAHATPLQPVDTTPFERPTYQPTLGSYRERCEPLPEAPPDILEPPDAERPPIAPRIRRVRLRIRDQPYTTLHDSFGRYRVYSTKPQSIPDSICELDKFSDIQPTANPHVASVTSTPPVAELIAPCPNISTFRLQHWHWNEGIKKSNGARDSLVHNVICQPDFVPMDLSDVNWGNLDNALACYSETSGSIHKPSSVSLSIPPRTPTAALHYKSNPSNNTVAIPTHHSVSLLGAVRSTFEKNDHRFFHYEPYESYCCNPKTSKVHHSYGEAYESLRMLEMHQAVQQIKLDKPCDLPRCVAAIMIFSDVTQLANFGSAKAWPIRVTFGNLSKYERCKPNMQNHHEVGFIPLLPSSIQDKLRELEPGRPVPKQLMSHLRRELIHEVWTQLLDKDFLRAWSQGIVIKCANGVTRRVFPRIFSYSADYPEKVLLATIRGMKSLRPCPRCLVPREEFKNMGLPSDIHQRKRMKRKDNQERSDLVHQARSVIFDEGRAVSSKRVEALLQPHSYVPTHNAFSRRLRYLGFDIFEALTVDFLHEFELGVWKSVFQHLLRVLHSSGTGAVATLNERFRLIPSFGNGTIRPFVEDVSDMTRPAARTYEDVLQCIGPALEGLLPASIEPHVLTLVYVLAEWHGLAKLRRHTSISIEALRQTTSRLGHELREFRHYTSEMDVYETPKEQTARQQRVRKRARPRAALANDSDALGPELEPAHEGGRRRKYFNLDTIKLHVLPDYPDSIEQFGTTDSTLTQTGELVHQHSKRRYARTNGKNYLAQMGKIQRIETRLECIQTNLNNASSALNQQEITDTVPPVETLPPVDSGRPPYQIAVSQKNPIDLPRWLEDHRSDPATKNFLPRLKAHLLARASGGQYHDELTRTSVELSPIHFQHNRIYPHHTLRVHYTTYDVRRAQDTINPRTPGRYVLLPSHEATHPDMGARRFWYARVLGIYHANISYLGSLPKRMDFLWVRWLSRMTDVPGGGETCRLDQLRYFQDSEEFHAFDFVDPIDIIRGVHLIPRFAGKQTTDYLSSVDSMAADNRCIGDWKYFYSNRFVDRDMLMRFTGMAIGHMTLSCNNKQTVAPPAEALDSGYEYIDMEPEEQNEVFAADDDSDDGGDDGGADNESEEGEEDTNEHGSDDDELVDEGEGTIDDEDEVSW